jgi:hypothetical protein
MKLATRLAALAACMLAQSTWSCELADTAMAERVLGSDVLDATADPARFCTFISTTTSASFLVQVDTAESYDQLMIPMPHTAVDIGDRGRYHEFERGGATVQFVMGNVAVTVGARPPSPGDRDYLPAVLEAAEAIAAQLD